MYELTMPIGSKDGSSLGIRMNKGIIWESSKEFKY